MHPHRETERVSGWGHCLESEYYSRHPKGRNPVTLLSIRTKDSLWERRQTPMECVTRVFYTDLPPIAHSFHACVCACVCACVRACVRAEMHLWVFVQGVNSLYELACNKLECMQFTLSSQFFRTVSYTINLTGTICKNYTSNIVCLQERKCSHYATCWALTEPCGGEKNNF